MFLTFQSNAQNNYVSKSCYIIVTSPLNLSQTFLILEDRSLKLKKQLKNIGFEIYLFFAFLAPHCRVYKSVYISSKMWKGEVLLGRTAYESAIAILPKLFQLPIVNVAIIQEWTGFTRQGAQKVIDRFVALGILEIKDENKTYGRSFIYRRYVDIFLDK